MGYRVCRGHGRLVEVRIVGQVVDAEGSPALRRFESPLPLRAAELVRAPEAHVSRRQVVDDKVAQDLQNCHQSEESTLGAVRNNANILDDLGEVDL